jgi:hypothetical protein
MLAREEGVTPVNKTSSATITTASTPGLLYGVSLFVTTAASSVTILNGGSGGTEVIKIAIDGSVAANANQSRTVNFPDPVLCSTDIYCTLSGSGATADVYYKQLT